VLLTINDRASHKITHREYTDEGFLRVPGRVARTGIQEYLARELGLPGDPNRVVRVYRPPSEVFKSESLSSFDGAVITIYNPAGRVNSTNYKKVAVGVVRGVGVQDGDFVKCDLIFQDADAINAINAGKCELSSGYTAVYDDTPGITPEGEPYDYTQTDIKINHVAAVYNARAGSQARVFDHTHSGGNTMPVLITTDSGRSVDVADPANAQVVADAFDRLTLRATTAEAAAEKAQATADGTAEKLTAALALGSDDAIKTRVAALGALNTTARKVAGDAFTCDSVDPTEVMRAALLVKRPSVDWAAKSPAYIESAFDQAVEDAPTDKTDVTTTVTGDTATVLSQLLALAKDASGKSTADTATPTVDAYAEYKDKQANAWKGK
jgi:uncharacterized protein